MLFISLRRVFSNENTVCQIWSFGSFQKAIGQGQLGRDLAKVIHFTNPGVLLTLSFSFRPDHFAYRLPFRLCRMVYFAIGLYLLDVTIV